RGRPPRDRRTGRRFLEPRAVLQEGLGDEKRRLLVERVVAVAALRGLDARRTARFARTGAQEHRGPAEEAGDSLEPPGRESDPSRGAVVDEDGGVSDLRMQRIGAPADV